MKNKEINKVECLLGGCPEIKKIGGNKFEIFDTDTPGIKFVVSKKDLRAFRAKISDLLGE